MILALKALADQYKIPNELVGNGIVLQPKVTLRVGVTCNTEGCEPGGGKWIVTVNGILRYKGDRTPDGLFFDMPEIIPEIVLERKP